MGVEDRGYYRAQSGASGGGHLRTCPWCGRSFPPTLWRMHAHNPQQARCGEPGCQERGVGYCADEPFSEANSPRCGDHLMRCRRQGRDVRFVDGGVCSVCDGHGQTASHTGEWLRCPQCFGAGYESEDILERRRERSRQEEKEARRREENRRSAEEARRRSEEASRAADERLRREEESRRSEEEARRQAEEARRAEESRRAAEEERRRQEANRRGGGGTSRATPSQCAECGGAGRVATKYHRVLDVPLGASTDEISQAFRRKAMQYHPDRNKAPDATLRMQEVSEARSLLVDSASIRAGAECSRCNGRGAVASERTGQSQAERDWAERERRERERAQREQAERERKERERAQAEREREKREREQAQREQAERERKERERQERERAQRDQAERERKERDKAERERMEDRYRRPPPPPDEPPKRRKGGGSSNGRGWLMGAVPLIALAGIIALVYLNLQDEPPVSVPAPAATPTSTPAPSPTLTPTWTPMPTATPFPCDPSPSRPAPTLAPTATPTAAATSTPTPTAAPSPTPSPTPDWPPQPLTDAWREWARGWSEEQVNDALAEIAAYFETGLDGLDALDLLDACDRVEMLETRLETAAFLVEEHGLERDRVPGWGSQEDWSFWLLHQRGLLAQAVLDHAPVQRCREARAAAAIPTPTPTSAPTPEPTPTATSTPPPASATPPPPSPTPTLPPCPTATPTPRPTPTPSPTPRPTPTPTAPPRPTATHTPTPRPTATPTPLGQRLSPAELQDLSVYALDLVNADRAAHGQPPLALGLNPAAQLHAEDMLAHDYQGHWWADGRKPYMVYSETGGTSYASENAASSGWTASQWRASNCDSSLTICRVTQPRAAIRELQRLMMYDDAHANWGHRDNILRESHRAVNFGVAFNGRRVTFAQHFEGGAVEASAPTLARDGTLSTFAQHFEGGAVEASAPTLARDGTLSFSLTKREAGVRIGQVVSVHYDPLPTPKTAAQIGRLSSYCVGGGFTTNCGDPIARILEPPGAGYFYSNLDANEIIAGSWNETGDAFRFTAALGNLATRPGVYTVLVWRDSGGGLLTEQLAGLSATQPAR